MVYRKQTESHYKARHYFITQNFKFLVFAGEIMLEDDMAKYVAVKILKEGVSREAKEDFKREVEIMSAFDHENILKLIGVVAIGENFYLDYDCSSVSVPCWNWI